MLSAVQVRSFDAPEINRREILRYALCREETQNIAQMIDECLEEALSAMSYRVCWAEYDVPQAISSRNLAQNLSGCDRVIAFAATVGLGLDRLLMKYSRIAPSKAVILQAIGAERIESLCDAFEEELRAQGYSLRPRFSPGYGDLPLKAQKEIFAALNCTHHIGVTLNDSLLMTPTKSVTALIGLCGGGSETAAGCSACPMLHCQFRRNTNEHS